MSEENNSLNNTSTEPAHLDAALESKGQFNSLMLRNWIEPFSKMSVMTAVICYAIGFIVVNSYLAKYGYFLLDFFRVGYISAGILAIGFALLPNIIFWAIVDIFRKAKPIPQRSMPVIAYQFFPGVSISFLLIILAFSTLPVWLRVWLGIVWLGMVSLWVIDNFKLESASGRLRFKNLHSTLVNSFVMLIFYFSSFGQYVYGLIPINFGGGKPTSVLIISDQDSRSYLELAGIKLYATDKFLYIDTSFKNKAISEPVGLLAESERSYTVIVKQNDSLKAVTFDKKLAKAVIHGSSIIIGSLKK